MDLLTLKNNYYNKVYLVLKLSFLIIVNDTVPAYNKVHFATMI